MAASSTSLPVVPVTVEPLVLRRFNLTDLTFDFGFFCGFRRFKFSSWLKC